jgi:hypothetical protein
MTKKPDLMAFCEMLVIVLSDAFLIDASRFTIHYSLFTIDYTLYVNYILYTIRSYMSSEKFRNIGICHGFTRCDAG